MWGGVRSVPGIVDSVVGRRPNTGARLGLLINQNSHVIRVPELCAAPRKSCNSNDAISTFEIHVGELRATFLRNHNMRCHKDPTKCPSRRQPKRKTTQAQKTPATPTAATTATSTGALHPIRGAAPVTWRRTRTEEVHCLRIGCSAPTNKNKRGTGTPNHSPPHPSMRSWALLAAGWARRPRRPRHHLHPGPLRPTPTPPTPLHAKSPLTCAQVGPERHLTGRRRDLWERTRPPMPQHLEMPPPTCSV